MMLANPRVRAVVGAGAALAVIAGVGIIWATSSRAASSRYVTAAASTGDVTQTYSATGTITRENTSAVSFAVAGTVKTVDVAVGDTVAAGDPLAVLDKGQLQLAVLNATTTVAQAEASLYSAQNPPSASGASRSGSSARAGGSGSSTPGTTTGVLIDPKVLNTAVSRINLAILNEADKCNAIFGSILPSPSPTATPPSSATSPMAPSSAASGPSASRPTAAAAPTATPTPPASATATATGGASPAQDRNPVATASTSQLARTLASGDFTDAQLQACADARAEVILANANLQQVVARLATPGGTGDGTRKPGSSGSSGSSGSAGASSAATVSASAVARAQASLLQARQGLASAKQNLSDATLVAPISGTVGLVGLTAGSSASAGSITIVGSGNAVVTFELPLATRELVAVGQSVTVTLAGSTKTLSGRITAIASLQTSGTSGDTSTYTTTVSVSDPAGLLASDAKGSVTIPVKSATGVVRVPASAVTPTGAGTATVQVVDNANATSASTVTVQTGAVGGGWVQITSGLDAGTLVVLADTTAAIPSNISPFQRTTSTRGATAAPTAGGQATAGPTSSATR